MFMHFKHTFQDIESDGAAGPVGTVADALAGCASSGGGEPSLLSDSQVGGGASTNESALAFPEKYMVKGETGEINVEESTRKLIDGYNNLSKKLGENGGQVPNSPAEYKIAVNVEELGLQDTITPEVLQNDPDFKNFLSEAHQLGFTNEQVNLIASKYVTVAQTFVDRRDAIDKSACEKTLRECWQTNDEYNANIANALKAFNRFADEQDRLHIDSLGNNPLAIRILAGIGAQMNEDSPARNAQSSESAESIQDLMRSEAYLDTNHKDHARVNARVQSYFVKHYGNEVVS